MRCAGDRKGWRLPALYRKALRDLWLLRGQAYPPRLRLRHGDDLALGAIQQVEDLLAPGRQRPALLGEPHAASSPCQQYRAGCARQGGELMGDGGLAEPQGLGGG